jgi:hypothetical protein
MIRSDGKKALASPIEEKMLGWQPSTILLASRGRPRSHKGFESKGLGLVALVDGKELKLETLWGVFHLGTGHLICTIRAHQAEAFEIATEITTLGDWNFDGLEGWKNYFS